LWSFGTVFILIGVGFILHWLPQRMKDGGVAAFAKLPMVVQMIGIALAILFMYQAVSDSFKPFVYLEF
jgi:hypothetical protein